MSTEDTLRGMGVGKVAEWNGRLEAVTKERDQLRAELDAKERELKTMTAMWNGLRAFIETVREIHPTITAQVDGHRAIKAEAARRLASGSSTGEANCVDCDGSGIAPSNPILADGRECCGCDGTGIAPAGPESPPAMYTTASPLGSARLSIDEQSAMAVVTPAPASNQCPAWCGKELPPHGVPGYGFLISSGLPSAVGERFKLGRESFVSRAMMRGWCSHECREREVARQGLAPAPASAECPDCKHPSHAANKCQSDAPSGHRCLCLAKQPASSVASWKVPLEESTQGTGAAQFAPTWAQFAALDKRVAALEAGQRILIGGSAPPQTAPVERRAENAPRCCDTACRYCGQKHWTEHEPREGTAPVGRQGDGK